MRAVGVMLLGLTGCSAVVGSNEEADAQTRTLTGVVVVDRVVSEEATRAEASARFISLRGSIDESALKLVGANLDLPAVGQCSVIRDDTVARSVELLDVGVVSLEALASGQRTLLTSRQVPDVVDLVSGTVYSARVDETSVPSASDVTVLVSGNGDVPAFSVRAQTPEVPSNVRVTNVDGRSVEVEWAPGVDTVYIDANGQRCSFADDGHAVVAFAGAGGELVLHRVRRAELAVPLSNATGELRFDFARAVSLRR